MKRRLLAVAIAVGIGVAALPSALAAAVSGTVALRGWMPVDDAQASGDRLPWQATRLPYKNFYALASVGFPSFCAFAFNNLANDAAGSFNNRTSFVAGDSSKPSNCASKTSRDGKSANASISFADKTDLSITPRSTRA